LRAVFSWLANPPGCVKDELAGPYRPVRRMAWGGACL